MPLWLRVALVGMVVVVPGGLIIATTFLLSRAWWQARVAARLGGTPAAVPSLRQVLDSLHPKMLLRTAPAPAPMRLP